MSLANLLSTYRPDDDPPLPLPEAAAETLKERLVEYLRPHWFSVGSLVTGKPGLDKRREGHAALPMIVLSLDVTGWVEAPPEHGFPAARNDIVVLSLNADGRAVPRLWNSSVLEPWPRAF